MPAKIVFMPESFTKMKSMIILAVAYLAGANISNRNERSIATNAVQRRVELIK